MRLSIISRVTEIEGGVTCWGRKAKVDKGLQDLHNPSDDVKAELNIIVLSFIQNNS